jgi:hypothetical protein
MKQTLGCYMQRTEEDDLEYSASIQRACMQQGESKVLLGKSAAIFHWLPDAPERKTLVLTMHLRGATPLRA